MKSKYTKSTAVMLSQIDAYGRLSAAETFDLVMNTAAEAAERMGMGIGFLGERGLIWITVKTRIRFVNPPALLDAIQVDSWPERPGEWRCERYYRIRRGTEVMAMGKTEWAIVDTRTMRPQRMEGLLPEDMEYTGEKVCPEPFPMIDEDFEEPPFAEHRVEATDIDMARHMNNVAYVRAIVNAFSTEQWHRMGVRQMDVVFRSSAHEGDLLRFQKRRTGDCLDIRGILPDGVTCVLARLTVGK